MQASACDACLVYLIDQITHEIVLRASQAPHVDDIGMLHVKAGEGITGWVAEHKSVVALGENAFRDPRFKKFPQLFEDTYEALLSVPLVGGGETIGVINVHHREPYRHSSDEISMMVFIGEQLGGAISKSLLEEERARLLEETQEMKRALETRKVMERAKGILQQRHQISRRRGVSAPAQPEPALAASHEGTGRGDHSRRRPGPRGARITQRNSAANGDFPWCSPRLKF